MFLCQHVTLHQIKDMILGIFPALHVESEELMISLYGENYANSQGSSPTASSGAKSPSWHAVGSFSSAMGVGDADDDDAGFQKLFGLMKQSVDQLGIDANRSSSPQTSSGHELGGSKRSKSMLSVVKNFKSRDSKSRESQRSDDDKADIPPSEREMFAFFKTNGTTKNIPIHLRTTIKLVKNRFFSKRECETWVHQIWKGKVSQMARAACIQSLTHRCRTSKRTLDLSTSFCCRTSSSSLVKRWWCVVLCIHCIRAQRVDVPFNRSRRDAGDGKRVQPRVCPQKV